MLLIGSRRTRRRPPTNVLTSAAVWVGEPPETDVITLTQFIHVVSAVLLVLSINYPVTAQNQLGDGRALDNNLQQGSGGTNQAQPEIDFRARNDLITGDVAGLGYFRGDVGYTAPGAFRGETGSGDLFRFQAQSFAPGPAGINRETGAPVSVYRPYAQPSAALGPEGGYGRITPPAGGFIQSGVVALPQADSGIGLTTPSAVYRAAPSAAPSGYSFGRVAQPDGRLIEVTASPLWGVRQRPIEPIPAAAPSAGLRSGASSFYPGGAGTAPAVLAPPALVIADQIQTQIAPNQRQGLTAEAGEQMLEYSRSSIFAPLTDRDTTQGDSVHRDLLMRIAEQAPRESGVSDDDAAAALLDAAAAARRARGLPALDASPTADSDTDRADGDDPSQRARPDAPDSALSRRTSTLDDLIDVLTYDLPPIPSLVGDRDDHVAKTQRAAEQDLRAGRYLDADRRYRQALRLAPDRPMARVGLLHAQIGAGAFRSAAFSLRVLFEAHPELISARFDRTLLPVGKRLDQMLATLDRLDRPDSDTDLSLLGAYIAFQLGDKDQLRRSLDTAATRHPNDRLPLLLRRIWLNDDSRLER